MGHVTQNYFRFIHNDLEKIRHFPPLDKFFPQPA
jgi:hypothetical protein